MQLSSILRRRHILKDEFWIVFCILFFGELTFFSNIKFFSIKPDFLLPLMLFVSIFLSLRQAIIYAVVIGLARDIFSYYPFAMDMLIFPFWAYLGYRISKRIDLDRCLIFAVFSAAIKAADFSLRNLIFLFFGFAKTVSFFSFLRILIFASIYAALISFLIIKSKHWLAPASDN